MGQDEKGFMRLTGKTLVAYVRMAGTVVVAVVVRICLDCAGIIATGQEPMEANFWFAHCRKDGLCVLAGIVIFLISLLGCSAFAWTCQDWITDPARNPFACRFSFAIIMEAATWVPISVVVGKTNAVVEWFMDIAEDDMLQALLSSMVAVVLTVLCAMLTHVAMKHCGGVQRSAEVKEAGWAGYAKFLVLATLYCLSWAVAWSGWALVLALMDVLEPRHSTHRMWSATGVISVFFVLSTCFYLRFGPEPIIPDPSLQQLCYNHGYSCSVRRAVVSYMVYSCVVFIVMCCVDPTYGFLILLGRQLYTGIRQDRDVRALLVLYALASVVTMLSALISAAISRFMEVDQASSMRLSRSLHEACDRMVRRTRSDFHAGLTQVLEDGSDVRLVEAAQGLQDGAYRPAHSFRFPLLNIKQHEEESEFEDLSDELADQRTPRVAYAPLSLGPGGLHDEEAGDLASERQLRLSQRLNPRAISTALCASVLTYDVLGFIVCFQWGAVALRSYSVLFGKVASIHDALYALSCLVYAGGVVTGVSWFVFSFFPSAEETSQQVSHGKSCS